MPGPGQSLSEIIASFLSEPIYRGILPGALVEFLQPPKHLDDESVGSFLRRRFPSQVADNIVSAVLHGIYAGDIERLSAKSLLSPLWFLESAFGSISRGVATNWLQKRLMVQHKDLDFLQSINSSWHDKNGMMHEGLAKFREILDSSVYTFRAGIEQLSMALEDELRAASNVTIRCNTQAKFAQLREREGSQKVRDSIRQCTDPH